MDAEAVRRALQALDDQIEKLRAEADTLAARFKAAYAGTDSLKDQRREFQIEADAAAAEMRRYNQEAGDAWNDDLRAEAKDLATLSDLHEAIARGLNEKAKECSAEIGRLVKRARQDQERCKALNDEVRSLTHSRRQLAEDLQRCTENPRYSLVKYDASGTILGRLYRRGNLTWEYDASGGLIGLSVHRGTQTIHYNASMRITGRSFRKGNMSEHYDANGKLTGRSVHHRDHTEHFDASGAPTGTTRSA